MLGTRPDAAVTAAAVESLHALTRREASARAARAEALANGEIRQVLNTVADAAAARSLAPEQLKAVVHDLLPLASFRHRLYSVLPAVAADAADAFTLPERIKMGWVFVKLGTDASTDSGYLTSLATAAGHGAAAAELEPKDSTLLAWCMTKAAVDAPAAFRAEAEARARTVLDGVLSSLPQVLDAYPPRSVPVLLWSMVNARASPRQEALNALAAYAASRADAFTPRDLIMTMWGLCKVGHVDERLLERMADPELARSLLSSSAEDLVFLVWCLGQSAPGSVPAFKAQALSVLQSRMRSLAMRQVTRALCAAGHFEPDGALPAGLIASACARFTALGGEVSSAQEAANLAWALARGVAAKPSIARSREAGPALRAVFAAIGGAVPELLPYFTLQGLANTAWAFAKAGMDTSRTVSLLGGELVARGSEGASPSEAVMTAWALATTGGDAEAYMTLVDDLVRGRADACSAQELSILISTLRRARSALARETPEVHRFVAEALDELAVVMRARLSEFDARSLCTNAFAYAKANHTSVNQFLLFSAIQNEIAARADELSGPDWANIAVACSRASTFSLAFFETVMGALVPQLPRLGPHPLKQVLSAATQVESGAFDARHPIYAALDETIAARLDELAPGWVAAACVSLARAGVAFPATRRAVEQRVASGSASAVSFPVAMGLAWALHTAHPASAAVNPLVEAMTDALVSSERPGAELLAQLSTSNMVRALLVLDSAGALSASPHLVAMFIDAIRMQGESFYSGFLSRSSLLASIRSRPCSSGTVPDSNRARFVVTWPWPWPALCLGKHLTLSLR
ncbi:uncharacterized protein AMSG_06107 [Thecamonas trahens ATCC 50062]|uniref:Uncharacterized protein n=1 Tax=Thecamonas trahens ATCC 50062 TaxID=461836 RepID=A0A0L0DC59_THETB|nr:hypothetical protein AMSG_06107 [Thecamonas trahens ATCC 50062]KNC49825.1 hypothetical protein AMSG_06107 [Thecamonas trahens ATCC 50062]|eukprot:XP_013757320.1 hypothetical protein AMSG_06107 [Thecamonas trahens ATCC 50062]